MKLMDLRTGRVITRRRITETPVTELIVQAVENMAIAQDITTLKITGRHTSPIYPTDWLAGVDYDDRQAHDRQRDEDYIEDEEAMIEDEIADEALYDRIDPEEIAYLRDTLHDTQQVQDPIGENQEVVQSLCCV
jgi:hypothetical protein